MRERACSEEIVKGHDDGEPMTVCEPEERRRQAGKMHDMEDVWPSPKELTFEVLVESVRVTEELPQINRSRRDAKHANPAVASFTNGGTGVNWIFVADVAARNDSDTGAKFRQSASHHPSHLLDAGYTIRGISVRDERYPHCTKTWIRGFVVRGIATQPAEPSRRRHSRRSTGQ